MVHVKETIIETALALLQLSALPRGANKITLALEDSEFAVFVSKRCCVLSYNQQVITHFAVSIGCNGRGNQNCTYFESQTITSTSCLAKICKCQSNICQVSKQTFKQLLQYQTCQYITSLG